MKDRCDIFNFMLNFIVVYKGNIRVINIIGYVIFLFSFRSRCYNLNNMIFVKVIIIFIGVMIGCFMYI